MKGEKKETRGKGAVLSVGEQLKLYSAVSGKHTDLDVVDGNVIEAEDMSPEDYMDRIAKVFGDLDHQVGMMLSLYGIPNIWELPGDEAFWQLMRIIRDGSGEVLLEFAAAMPDGVRTRTERFGSFPEDLRGNIAGMLQELMEENDSYCESMGDGDGEDVPPMAYIDGEPVYDSGELAESLHDILDAEIGGIYDGNVGEWGKAVLEGLGDLLFVSDCFEILMESSDNPEVYRINAVTRMEDGELALVGDRWRTRNARRTEVAVVKVRDASLGVLMAVLHRLEEWLEDDGQDDGLAED